MKPAAFCRIIVQYFKKNGGGDVQAAKSRKPPFALRALAVFGVTLGLLFLLLLGACALPGGPVRAHLADSARTIQQEGLYPAYFGFKLFQMDNYTDTLMLMEAATADETGPLTAMMTNTVYNVDNFETLGDDLAAYLEARAGGDPAAVQAAGLEPFSYARYWHGYLIWLRPLLCLMPYTGVRAVQYALLFALLAAALVLLRRRCGRPAALWFAASQLLVTVFWVPHQIQYFTCFALAYAGGVWVLAKPRRSDVLCLCLVALGVATAFCDLLVTPVLTLGLPMACWLLQPQQRLRAGGRQCALCLGGCLCWGVGYGLCWAAKWVLAALVTGRNVVADALHQIGVRTAADTWHGMTLTWGNIFRFVYDTLQGRGLFWPLVAAAVLAVALFVCCLRSRGALVRALPLGFAAALPLVWFAALRAHSIQHGWFTWRALGLTLFASMAFVYHACDLRTALGRLKQKGKSI